MLKKKLITYSPRMWRWSYYLMNTKNISGVFSTYVEVIPVIQLAKTARARILHVCGGDPPFIFKDVTALECSPRMWRWSLAKALFLPPVSVFSTYVEVIPIIKKLAQPALGILHVCGGDPLAHRLQVVDWLYSPRMWRWSLNHHRVNK